MGDALIGHTGFVGGTLLGDRPFAATYNSGNIEEIAGQRFDRIVCAGVPAVKWLANREPKQDWRGIARLIACLEKAEAEHFVLISTVDVYREPVGLSERDPPETAGLHAYGMHRLRVEEFVRERFRHSIVRLPALFGTGLKKNALYDLLHLNQTEKIAPNAAYQWYPICRLTEDLDRIKGAGIDVINITSEPIEMEQIRARFFPGVPIGPVVPAPPIYDLRTIHAGVLGGRGGYHFTAGAVLAQMSDFVSRARQR